MANAGLEKGKNAFARMTPEQRAEYGRKGAEKANETKKHQESTPKASRRPGIGSFFRDLFSGIDE